MGHRDSILAIACPCRPTCPIPAGTSPAAPTSRATTTSPSLTSRIESVPARPFHTDSAHHVTSSRASTGRNSPTSLNVTDRPNPRQHTPTSHVASPMTSPARTTGHLVSAPTKPRPTDYPCPIVTVRSETTTHTPTVPATPYRLTSPCHASPRYPRADYSSHALPGRVIPTALIEPCRTLTSQHSPTGRPMMRLYPPHPPAPTSLHLSHQATSTEQNAPRRNSPHQTDSPRLVSTPLACPDRRSGSRRAFPRHRCPTTLTQPRRHQPFRQA